MSTCMYCGAENAEGAQQCAVCGNQLPQFSNKKSKKKKKRKGAIPVKICVPLILAVCILIGGGLWLLHHFSPASRLDRAFDATILSLKKECMRQESMKSLINVLDKVTDSEKASFRLANSRDAEKSFALSVDCNHKKHAIAGVLQATDGDFPTTMRFSIVNDVFQFELPDIAPDVYGFSLKKVRESAVVQSLQSILGVDLSSVFSSDLSSILEDYSTLGRNIWEDFWDAAEVTALDNRDDYDVYRVTWSLQALVEQHSKTNGSALSDLIYNLLWKIDGGFTCFVNEKGMLSKVEAAVGKDLYSLSWSEQENPWETFSVVSTGSTAPILEGKIQVDGQTLHVSLVSNGNKNLFDLDYRGDTHAFELKTASLSINGFLEGSDDSIKIQLAENGVQGTNIEFGKLSNSPERIARKYVNLLDMKLNEISELAIRLTTNMDKVKTIWKLFSELIRNIQP